MRLTASDFYRHYQRLAQAILKTVPGAHREEDPESNTVSIQPG